MLVSYIFNVRQNIFYLVALVCYWQVMHRQLLRPGVVLGSFKLDVATVLSQQGSNQTAALSLVEIPPDTVL